MLRGRHAGHGCPSVLSLFGFTGLSCGMLRGRYAGRGCPSVLALFGFTGLSCGMFNLSGR